MQRSLHYSLVQCFLLAIPLGALQVLTCSSAMYWSTEDAVTVVAGVCHIVTVLRLSLCLGACSGKHCQLCLKAPSVGKHSVRSHPTARSTAVVHHPRQATHDFVFSFMSSLSFLLCLPLLSGCVVVAGGVLQVELDILCFVSLRVHSCPRC